MLISELKWVLGNPLERRIILLIQLEHQAKVTLTMILIRYHQRLERICGVKFLSINTKFTSKKSNKKKMTKSRRSKSSEINWKINFMKENCKKSKILKLHKILRNKCCNVQNKNSKRKERKKICLKKKLCMQKYKGILHSKKQ